MGSTLALLRKTNPSDFLMNTSVLPALSSVFEPLREFACITQ